ncbi:MAG TPA: ABC transporter ATP-binding protein [Ktedonobacterales bacterium]|jgi:iron complex transport system ATP-binding protein
MVTKLLIFEGVTFGYTNRPLFVETHLTLARGEMVGLLGPNGTGKTTLLRLAAGTLQPRQGNVWLDGHDLRALPRREIARRLAVVPQQFTTPFAFTVRELVGLGRTPHLSFLGTERPSDRQAIQQALAVTQTDALAGRIFNELSDGEKQRVALAMALAQQPDVLLLDEPTAHLDLKYQISMLDLLQRLNREQGLTILATMHDLNLAARYFPRLVLFQQGIVADGSPVEVLQSRLLSRVYEVPVEVGILRGATHLSILPPQAGHDTPSHTMLDVQEGEDTKPPEPYPLVHLFGGGGSAEVLMRGLADAGIPFSIGALNIGDSDHALALRLAADLISEQPYTPIAPGTAGQVQQRLNQVQAQILCPFFIGLGNLVLLRLALDAARHGLPTVILEPGTKTTENGGEGSGLSATVASRDYTGGEGAALYEELLALHPLVASDAAQAIRLLTKTLSARAARKGATSSEALP